jgi:hypothetical protein
MAKRKRLDVLANWDEIQHDPVSDPPNVSRMAKAAKIDAIIGWFLTNFEDPVHETPYESAEGGYQYIWGGPYETRDIIESVFAGRVDQSVIEEIIGRLESETSEWVPSSNRRQAPEPDPFEDDAETGPSQAELYDEMKKRISALEEALERVPKPPSGIGHNNPPEPMDLEPLDEDDRREVKDALATLNAQPVAPSNKGLAATAFMMLEAKRAKLSKWLAQQGVLFTREAVKEAGKQFGRWAPAVFWLWLLHLLVSVIDAAGAWLHVITDALF